MYANLLVHDSTISLPTRPLTIVYEPARFCIFVRSREYVKRGLLALLAFPALFAVLLGLIGLLVAGQSDGDPPIYVFAVIWCLISALSATWGLGLLFGANHWSERSRLEFDGQRWTMRRRGVEQPLTAFASVRARRPNRALKWWALELVPHGGLAPLTVYGHFVPRERAALQSYAAWLASMLRLRLDVDPALSTLDATGVDERTAAMLCYLPIQGIFIGASLYYLLRGDTRPLVRFSARQSLCQLLLSSLLLLLIIALFGVPLALVPDGPVRIVLLVVLTVSLVGFVIWNIWAHILACSRAYRRIAWVMPWLGPVVRRWLPQS